MSDTNARLPPISAGLSTKPYSTPTLDGESRDLHGCHGNRSRDALATDEAAPCPVYAELILSSSSEATTVVRTNTLQPAPTPSTHRLTLGGAYVHPQHRFFGAHESPQTVSRTILQFSFCGGGQTALRGGLHTTDIGIARI